MSKILLQVYQFLENSRSNGPGLRAVLWVQGCALGCPACFNSQTHPFEGGEFIAVEDLIQRFVALKNTIEGITISGGEPLQQSTALLALLQAIKQQTTLSVLLFSGFTWGEIQAMPQTPTLLNCIDVLIAGRYDQTQRLGYGLQGSANQTIHLLTDRYTLSDLEAVPPTEVIITPTGEVIISGIDPLKIS